MYYFVIELYFITNSEFSLKLEKSKLKRSNSGTKTTKGRKMRFFEPLISELVAMLLCKKSEEHSFISFSF